MYISFLQFEHFILIVIPRSSAATGTKHSNCNLRGSRSHEMPRSSAAVGSFTESWEKSDEDVGKLINEQ
jgi:hypothetical protein